MLILYLWLANMSAIVISRIFSLKSATRLCQYNYGTMCLLYYNRSELYTDLVCHISDYSWSHHVWIQGRGSGHKFGSIPPNRLQLSDIFSVIYITVLLYMETIRHKYTTLIVANHCTQWVHGVIRVSNKGSVLIKRPSTKQSSTIKAIVCLTTCRRPIVIAYCGCCFINA